MTKAPFAVVTGGGTGGHVTPALAIAEALVEQGRRREEILLVGAKRGVEVRLVPAAGFELVALPGRGIKRSLSADNLTSALGLASALVQAVAMAARARPKVVVTVGGYAGFAYAAAAVLLRIPLVVVTVDATPGAVNRLVGRFATANATALPAAGLPRATVTGAPLRSAARRAARDEEARRRAFSRLGLEEKRRLVVVTGGSLGAGRINDATLEMARGWAERSDLAIYHVTGERNFEEMRKKAASAGLSEAPGGLCYILSPFDTDLPGVLAGSDLAVCRAGALSVAELTALGLPSILVPLPGAPGDHQTHNATTLQEQGAAVLLRDDECDGARLAGEVARLLEEPGRLEAMGKAAARLGARDGAERVAELVEQVARGRKR